MESTGRYPLFDRFPALAKLPLARLCELPSPVQRFEGVNGIGIWIKRDDLNAPLCGGNKARALEFLLGGIGAGDTVVTVGGAGSTHVLATALHAARLGAKTVAYRWTHDMNPVAEIVSGRIARAIPEVRISRSPVLPIVRARIRGLRTRSLYIPPGGSTPLGVLGHVNAAFELAAQVERGELPMPDRIVLPLATGGTAAGLLLGLAIAGLRIEIVGARAGPAVIVHRRRVLGLARKTAELIKRLTGGRLPAPDPSMLRVVHHVYGGAYGRALPEAAKAAEILHEVSGIRLDGTYSEKAWMASLDEARTSMGPVLFWLTFDPKCLTN